MEFVIDRIGAIVKDAETRAQLPGTIIMRAWGRVFGMTRLCFSQVGVKRTQRAAVMRGAQVVLVSGPTAEPAVPGVEQVVARVGAHRPVVVLARAVDAGERLLVQQTGEAVTQRDLLHGLHGPGGLRPDKHLGAGREQRRHDQARAGGAHRVAAALEVYERRDAVTQSHIESLEHALELAQSRARSLRSKLDMSMKL